VIEVCDLVAFDTDLIGPYGYCADISRTWLCGDGRPSNAQTDLYRRAREQIAYNLELVRPGLGLREFSDKAFPLPERFLANRYSAIAHGVGVCDEYPAVYYSEDAEVTGYDGVLEAGMTICVESYIGEAGGAEGVKLEEQVLVTDTGAEVLSRYSFEDAVFR
jgi:Xaa-Pro aminopeptidase